MGNLVAVTDICASHEVEITFITSLGDAGLIGLSVVNEQAFVPADELQKLEKMIRMHIELEINVAGIEAIIHLLSRVEQMQSEILLLKSQLALQPEATIMEL